MTATTQTTTATVKGATMSAIRAALPVYFAQSVERAILATANGNTGTEARRVNLAHALVGAALEKMQSGNFAQALGNTTAALETLKGKNAERVNNALSLVMACPNKGMHSATVEAYKEKAETLFVDMVQALTPEAAPAKPKAEKINWQDRAEKAEHALTVAQGEADALRLKVAELQAALDAATHKVAA